MPEDTSKRLHTDVLMDRDLFMRLSFKLHHMTSGTEIGLRNLHNWSAVYKDYDAGVVNTRWNELTQLAGITHVEIKDMGPLRKLVGAAIDDVQAENSGGNVSYYLCPVNNPNQAADPYVAECGDIIESLGMDFNEATAFKSIWRKAAERTLGKKKAGNEARRDAEKVIFYGKRMLALITGKKV